MKEKNNNPEMLNMLGTLEVIIEIKCRKQIKLSEKVILFQRLTESEMMQ